MSKVTKNEDNDILDILAKGTKIAKAINDVETVDIFIYSQICSRKSPERKATLKLLSGKEWAKQLHEWSEVDNVFITKYESKDES